MFNPLKFFRNRSVGLVLGSGGAKGIAHISVIEYLLSMNIPINMISGSSIGAVVGSVFCCGKLDDFKKDILSMSQKEMLSYFDLTLPRSGLIKGNGFIDFMKNYVPADCNIEDLSLPLGIVATDYSTGEPVVFKQGSVLNALRASVSIPGILVPVSYKNTFLIDGGVSRPLPVDVVKDMGAGIVIAVNLHPGVKPPYMRNVIKQKMDNLGFASDKKGIKTAEKGESLSIPSERKLTGWFSTIDQWVKAGKSSSGGKTPSIFEILSQSVDIMSFINTERTLLYHKPAVIIEPLLPDIGTLDFDRGYKIITEGYSACSRVKKRLNNRVKAWI